MTIVCLAQDASLEVWIKSDTGHFGFEFADPMSKGRITFVAYLHVYYGPEFFGREVIGEL